MFEEIDRYLAHCTPLSAEELSLFHSLLKPAAVKSKAFLLREGEVCAFEYFVLKGCLRKYCIDDSGHEVNLQFAVESWWMSDLSSFSDQLPSRLFIQALEDTEMLAICYADKELLFKKVPALERMFRLLVQRSMSVMQDRFVSLLTLKAGERYLAFLERYPGLPQRIPQHYIASYLGMTPEFLSKVHGRLAKR